MLLVALLLATIIYFVDKFKSRPANIIDGQKQNELLDDSIGNHNDDKITVDNKPRQENIIYKDKIVYRDKIIYRDTIIYKTSQPKTIYQDKIVYKDKIIYQDKIVYRDKPEPYHQYGKGMCKIVVYTTCSTGGTTKVWIDGEYTGSYNHYSLSAVGCSATSGISKILISGKHHIYTKNDANEYVDKYITISEDECYPFLITCN
jgi:hypothetical protein